MTPRFREHVDGEASAAAAPTNLDVRSVGFAPVKGTRHLTYDEVPFDGAGPVRDRRYCLVDVETRHVLKTNQHPTLIAVIARQFADALEIALPTGESLSDAPRPTGQTMACDYWGRTVELELVEGPHAPLLSAWLGRHVRLAVAPRGAVVFGAPVTIVTTASLRDLGARAGRPDLVAQAARFRSTLVVDTEEPYTEERWQGRRVCAGGVLLRVRGAVPRCTTIDLDPTTGARGGGLLKALVSYRPTNTASEPYFGVYAEVIDVPAPISSARQPTPTSATTSTLEPELVGAEDPELAAGSS